MIRCGKYYCDACKEPIVGKPAFELMGFIHNCEPCHTRIAGLVQEYLREYERWLLLRGLSSEGGVRR